MAPPVLFQLLLDLLIKLVLLCQIYFMEIAEMEYFLNDKPNFSL
jgi:hypothetical protein